MANLDENFLQNTHNKPLLYLRYINDIFLLWTHGEELLQFHKDFNSENPGINITMNHLAEEVNFLDTTIKLKIIHSILHYIKNPPISKSIYTPSAALTHLPVHSF